MATYEECEAVCDQLFSQTDVRPSLAIVTGSGLGALADLVQGATRIPYSDIHGFTDCTVPGHAGCLVFGHLEGLPVVVMQGRVHGYEGASMILPIRVMKLMGVQKILLTAAVGGLTDQLKAGDIVIVKDHISLADMSGASPLKGPNDERFGPRFPSLNQVWKQQQKQSCCQHQPTQ